MAKRNSSKSSFALMTSVLAFGLAIFAFWTMNSLIDKQTARAEEVARRVAEVTLQKEREMELQEKIQENKDARSMLNNLIVPKDDLVGFIETIEGVGDMSGAEVIISSIDAQSVITAKIEAKGSWANVIRAVKLIENMPFRIKVSDLKVEKGGSDGEVRVQGQSKTASVVWKANFSIETPVR